MRSDYCVTSLSNKCRNKPKTAHTIESFKIQNGRKGTNSLVYNSGCR